MESRFMFHRSANLGSCRSMLSPSPGGRRQTPHHSFFSCPLSLLWVTSALQAVLHLRRVCGLASPRLQRSQLCDWQPSKVSWAHGPSFWAWRNCPSLKHPHFRVHAFVAALPLQNTGGPSWGKFRMFCTPRSCMAFTKSWCSNSFSRSTITYHGMSNTVCLNHPYFHKETIRYCHKVEGRQQSDSCCYYLDFLFVIIIFFILSISFYVYLFYFIY